MSELGILSQEIQPEEIPYKFNRATYNLQMWKGLSCCRYENEPDFTRNFYVGGHFKCYMPWGWGGGGQNSREKCYEGVSFNIISVTRERVGVKFAEKKRYVTLEWPLGSSRLPGRIASFTTLAIKLTIRTSCGSTCN